jgi:hypothetical protein
MNDDDFVLETEATTLIDIYDTRRGTLTSYTAGIERVYQQPATGMTRIEQRTTLLRSAEGNITKPENSKECLSCTQLFGGSVPTCRTCPATVCTGCSHQGQCTACYQTTFWERVWQWLTTL